MSADRMRRIDGAMREILGEALAQDLKDPRIGFVTVTDVKTTSDLRQARVFVSVLGDEATREATMNGLQSAHGFLQRHVAAKLRLKNTPTLSFHYDDTAERAMRVERLLKRETDSE
jgi:ribosome-binding factor A